MQTKSKHMQLLAAALTIALLLAGILTLLHGIPLFRADAAEAQSEEANVYADWKFSEENSSGSLEDNTLVIEDASGKGNNLKIVTSENGAKASDFLAFEDISMTGDAQSMKFNGFKEEDQEQLDTLTGDAREQYILNDLEYAYLRTADEAPINEETFMNGYTIELVFMMPVDYDASDAWMNILAREGSGAQLGSGQWDYEGHHGTMQINISNCKEIQYMTQNGTNTKFNSTLWGLSMDNGGAWYHIAITCDGDGSELKAYTNSGDSFRNYTGGGMDGMYAAADGGNFRVGAVISNHLYKWADSAENDLVTKLLRGNLQEIRISEGALTQEQWLLNPKDHVGSFGNNEEYELKSENNYTFAFLPDTQNTIKFTPEVSDAATAWLIENQSEINLKGLSHVGDLVENWNDDVQWQSAEQAFLPLAQAGIPITFVPGNHDFSGSNLTSYQKYFGADSAYAQAMEGNGNEVYFEAVGGDSRQVGSYTFVEGGSYTYLFIQLMYEPNDRELAWLDGILSKYPDNPAIITSHNIFSCSASKPDECDLNEQGERIWSVAKQHDNVFMITGGHNHGSGFIDLTNDFGNPVVGMLVDYQFSYNGGNAWYRFMEMDETNNKIYFSTFSPYEASLTAEEKTGYFDLNFMTGSGNEREYDFDFEDRFGFAFDTISLSIGAPAKTVYTVGDTLDLTGLVVTAHSADANRVVTDYTVSEPDMSTAGAKTVTVSYDGATASFTIYVQAADSSGSDNTDGGSGSDNTDDTQVTDEGGCGSSVAAAGCVAAAIAAGAAVAAAGLIRKKKRAE